MQLCVQQTGDFHCKYWDKNLAVPLAHQSVASRNSLKSSSQCLALDSQ